MSAADGIGKTGGKSLGPQDEPESGVGSERRGSNERSANPTPETAAEIERTNLILRGIQLEKKLDLAHKIATDLEVRLSRESAKREAADDFAQHLKSEIEQVRQDLQTAKSELRDAKAAFESETNELRQASDHERQAHTAAAAAAKQRDSRHAATIASLEQALADEQERAEHILSKNTLLREDRNAALERAQRTERTIAYQLGHTLIFGFKSWRGFISMPRRFFAIGRDARQRRKPKPKSESPDEPSAPPEGLQTTEGTSKHPPEIRVAPSAPPPRLNVAEDRPLRIAAVMDEFTAHSYAPECELLQLRPDACEDQLADFQPDLMFIESAWKGIDDSWKLKISTPSDEILGAIKWCRANNVPVMFWSKEDPVHFDSFLPIASQADYVFTTDIDCIGKYKFRLGHDRVYLLPFAAQPQHQNPIETFERKDAFNFAGSYYLRYPERQRDFDTLIRSVEQLRPLEIFDRNFDNPHPHYTFPDSYSDKILGSLPFSEIDRAYKGYRFGINMNTIKQSQTMFARRVFELMASNTIVVSNFSRGARHFFGDLIISSDHEEQLRKRLDAVCSSESDYRKLRLLGLRKVMSEHTYSHRLNTIKSRLSRQAFSLSEPSIAVMARAQNQAELDWLIEQFGDQDYEQKALFIWAAFGGIPEDTPSSISIFEDFGACKGAIVDALQNAEFLALFHADNRYGPQYLTDLALADRYTSHAAFGKASFFAVRSDACELDHDGSQYQSATSLEAAASIARSSRIAPEWIASALQDPDGAYHLFDDMLGLDEFHYCQNGRHLGSEYLKSIIEDLPNVDQGASLDADIVRTADAISSHEGGPQISLSQVDTELPALSGSDLYDRMKPPKSNRILLLERDGALEIASRLPADKFGYVYLSDPLSRDECNFRTDSRFQLLCDGDLNTRTVFEFLDSNGEKISHSINHAGNSVSLAIPTDCEKLRFGIRVQGSGTVTIEKLVFGSKKEHPALIVGRSPYMVLAREYPAYDDLYRYGFLHSRVRGYRQAGINADVFRLRDTVNGNHFREFEGIDVASGDETLLRTTLDRGEYRHILVHLLNHRMWAILKDYVDTVQVSVWVHGSEVQPFHRREYNMTDLPAEEVDRQQKLSDQRLKFWRDLLREMPANLHLIFVSQYFADEVMEDLGFTIPSDRYSIIHNPIDTTMFNYVEKDPEQRKKILSIRPYSSRKYANDLTVQAILNLQHEDFFQELDFRLIGDGPLFDETVAPLQGLSNIRIEKKFLTHREISAIHKDYGVCLMPTRMDAQGVSRDEAMASGLVPITNRVAAIPEFVDEKSAILADPDDAAGLSAAIAKLYRDPILFSDLSKAASERVAGQSAADIILGQELDLIIQKAITDEPGDIS